MPPKRSVDAICAASAEIWETVTPDECRNDCRDADANPGDVTLL